MSNNKDNKKYDFIFVILFIAILFLLFIITFLLFNSYKNKKEKYTFGTTYMTMDNQYFVALNSK